MTRSRGEGDAKRSARRAAIGVGIALAATAGAGCRTHDRIENPLPIATSSPPAPPGLHEAASLQQTMAGELEALESAFADLHRSGGWQRRGYFTATEHDAIEGLFFRFTALEAALWGGIDRLGGIELAEVDGEAKPRAHVLVLHAGLALSAASSALVAEFVEDPIAVAKLNEPFYRSEIPEGSYDALRLAVTSESRRRALAEAWSLHERALADPDSGLGALRTRDSAFAGLLEAMPGLHARAQARREAVRAHEPPGPVGLGVALRHSEVADLGRAADAALGDAGYATRALVFKDVSRVKSPTTHLVRFSPEQKRKIHAALRPGDLILTYTAGYVSDVFIPGRFKHGITYVGGAEERRAAGLDGSSLRAPVRREQSQFASDLARVELPDGSRADLIEAVAEGVKFSNLDRILDTHVNRIAVLRPRLAPEERTSFLAGVFSYVGDPYDFRFDFADASRQVCTEVIYRALDGKADIHFGLTTRGGHPTLSADDIVHYSLSAGLERFDLVLFAEEDPQASDHRARIWTGEEGRRRLVARMDAGSG